MRISIAKLRKIFPSGRAELMQAIVDHWDLAEDAGVTTVRIAATFLGNIGAETGGLRSIEENLNYSAKRLLQVWPSRFKTIAQAQKVAGKPEALANLVYGGRLGNKAPGDGWKYRGSGMLQTTGRANFRKAGYEDDPEGLREPDTAFASACTFWRDHNLSALAATGNEAAVRKVINGGTNGLDEARAYAAQARKALGSTEAVGLLSTTEATGVAADPAEAAPGPSQAPPTAEPTLIHDEDGDGIEDPVAQSNTLEDLRGKLATANDAVTSAGMIGEPIVRVGRRVWKWMWGGGAAVVAGPPLAAASLDEGNRGFLATLQDWAHAIPPIGYIAVILALMAGFAFYAHFNVAKRVQLQKQGLVLPQAPK